MSRNSKEKRDKKKRNELKRHAERKRTRELRAKPLPTLGRKRDEYIGKWRTSAEAFAAAGHYEWMAQFVNDFERVLEIGTGEGSGTIALVRAGHVVMSVDENPACLDAAEEALGRAGIAYRRIRREILTEVGDLHRIEYGALEAALGGERVLLVEADVLNDPGLWQWATSARFDAVTCWLMGAHQGREYNDALQHMNITSAGRYRLKVQNKVYELADKVLRPGGLLHLVDRGEPLATPALVADAVASHRDQAGPTTLVVDPNPQQRPYKEPLGGVETIVTRGLSGRDPEGPHVAFISNIARKP